MKRIVYGCLMFALATAGATFEPAVKGEVSITGLATVRVDRRIARDFPIRRDMTQVKSSRLLLLHLLLQERRWLVQGHPRIA